MRKSRFFKRLPTPQALKDSRFLKPFARYLDHHSLWQLNRRSVAGGLAVGLFFGILLPFAQIPAAAIGAVFLRVNLPVAVVGTFITNPFTFPPIYYFAYKLGGFITGFFTSTQPPEPPEGAAEKILAHQTQIGEWITNLIGWAQSVGLPLIVGLVVLSVTASAAGYFIISGLWRLHAVRRWRTRLGYQPLLVSNPTPGQFFKITKHLALGIGFLSFIVVAALDVLITPRISLLLLHLLPVMFVTWFAGPRWGVFFAVAMTAIQAVTGGTVTQGTRENWYWYFDVGSDFFAALLLVWLQTKLRRSYEQVLRLSRHDTLTHSLNRNGFYDALLNEIERRKRYGHPFSLIYFDCDNFKHINDAFGHKVGDQLLVKVSQVLRRNLRGADCPGRLGGDEFAILLPESDDEAARKTVLHLKEKLDAAMLANKWPVSFSIGVATFVKAPEGIDQAIEFADMLMYEVKKTSKNDILFRSFA